MKKTLTIDQMDKLIGFGKPASKTADWIVNTYLPNAPVSNRLSIEHAIAQAIVEASAEPASLGAAILEAAREIGQRWYVRNNVGGPVTIADIESVIRKYLQHQTIKAGDSGAEE